MALTFRPPASPRSAVTRMSNRFLIGRAVRNGCGDPVVRLATSVSTSAIRSAYGRAASALTCTRRSLDAATACMARVICWVFFRLAIRRRISARVASLFLLDGLSLGGPPSRLQLAAPCRRGFAFRGRALRLLHQRTRFLELVDGGPKRLLGLLGNGFVLRNGPLDVRMRAAQEAEQLFLKRLHLIHGDVVQVAVGAGEE